MTHPIYDLARECGKADRLGELKPLQRGAESNEIAKPALVLASNEQATATARSGR